MSKPRAVRINNVYWYIIFFLALCLFIAFSITRIQQPVAQDELHKFVAAKTLLTTGVPQRYAAPDRIQADSPHLYLRSMVFAFRIFGVSEIVARLPGVVSVLLAIVMVFFITHSLSKGDQNQRLQWAGLSSLLYASTPAVIQGSLILDNDNTILIPTVLLLCWSFIKYQQEEKVRWAILTGLAMAISLWVRVTTPPIVALLLLLYVLISKRSSRTKLISMGAILFGTLLFLVSWYLYCKVTGVPFSQPFTYAIKSLQRKAQGPGGLTVYQVFQNLILLSLWLGIFPLFLLLFIMKRRCKSFIEDRILNLEDIFLLGGLIIIGGYMLIGGTVFGYPKYHGPGIPLLYIYIGIVLSQLKSNPGNHHLLKIVTIAVAVFAIQVFLVGDVIYVIRYSLRESLALMQPPYQEILKNLASKAILFVVAYAILFVACLRLSFKENMVGLLLIFSIGSNIGTSYLHSTADYYIGYNYGGKGTREAARYIRDRVPSKSIIIAPSELIYYLNLTNSKHISNPIWTDTDELKRRLINENTSGLAYSITTNTVNQIKIISRDKTIQELLRKSYDQTKIGTFMVWLRKE